MFICFDIENVEWDIFEMIVRNYSFWIGGGLGKVDGKVSVGFLGGEDGVWVVLREINIVIIRVGFNFFDCLN